MEKTSKVLSVQANGSWDGKFGTMYKFELGFENGDTGEYSSKSSDQKKFIQGQDATYTIDMSNPTYPKIKPIFNQSGGSFGGGFSKENPERQKMIVKQSSLKVAADLCIANDKADLNSVFIVAEKIVEWVMTEKSTDEVKPIVKEVKKEVNNFAQQSGANDLPF
jgi:hypothetical protein